MAALQPWRHYKSGPFLATRYADRVLEFDAMDIQVPWLRGTEVNFKL